MKNQEQSQGEERLILRCGGRLEYGRNTGARFQNDLFILDSHGITFKTLFQTYFFPRAVVREVKPHATLADTGIRAVHRRAIYPPRVLFFPQNKDREALEAALRGHGFEVKIPVLGQDGLSLFSLLLDGLPGFLQPLRRKWLKRWPPHSL